MNAIEALIQRMDQAPEEFAEDGSWKHTRWAQITDIMVAESTLPPVVFTKEENTAYMSKLGAIVRKQLEEHICVEILNPLRSDQYAGKQMDLFTHQDYRVTVGSGGGGGSGSVIGAAQIQNQALRMLEDEMDKHKQVHKETQEQHRQRREKEREGVMQRMQNTIKALRKQTP